MKNQIILTIQHYWNVADLAENGMFCMIVPIMIDGLFTGATILIARTKRASCCVWKSPHSIFIFGQFTQCDEIIVECTARRFLSIKSKEKTIIHNANVFFVHFSLVLNEFV